MVCAELNCGRAAAVYVMTRVNSNLISQLLGLLQKLYKVLKMHFYVEPKPHLMSIIFPPA